MKKMTSEVKYFKDYNLQTKERLEKALDSVKVYRDILKG